MRYQSLWESLQWKITEYKLAWTQDVLHAFERNALWFIHNKDTKVYVKTICTYSRFDCHFWSTYQQTRYRWKDTAEHCKMIQKYFEKWRTEAEELKMKILGFFSTTGMSFKFLLWKLHSLLITYVKFHFHKYDG